MNCPKCAHPIPDEDVVKAAGSINGKKKKKNEKNAEKSRENGRKSDGRPRKRS